jgi:hypothetical protein
VQRTKSIRDKNCEKGAHPKAWWWNLERTRSG